MLLNVNLIVTMAKLLNNINFWSGNPGKTSLVFYTFEWGWGHGKNTGVNTFDVIFLWCLGSKKKSLEMREKQAAKEERQKEKKVETSAEKLRKLLKEEKR